MSGEALGELARQLRWHAERDAGLGVWGASVPALPPLKLPARAAAQPPIAAAPQPPVTAPSSAARRPSGRELPQAPPEDGALFREAPADPDAIPQAPLNEPAEQLAARREAGEAALVALFREIDGCLKCRLHEGRTRLVFGQGDAAAEIAFVGEGPGYNEDKQGIAFCGASGELLTKMIRAMGLERDEVFIANVVKCRPPENRNPAPDEMATCLPYLARQLEIVRPRVICALGKTAGVGLGLLRPDESLGRNRGFSHRWRGIRVMLTYHPAYLLRNPPAKRKAWHDLQQILPYLQRRRAGGAA